MDIPQILRLSNTRLYLASCLIVAFSICGCDATSQTGSNLQTTTASSLPSEIAASDSEHEIRQLRRIEARQSAALPAWMRPIGTEESLTREQITSVLDTLFSANLTELKPAVLVLPITDGQGATRADGLALCYQSLMAIARANPKVPIAVYPRETFHMLNDTQCGHKGFKMTDALRAACTASVNAKLSISASLSEKGSGWELSVAFAGIDGVLEPTRITHMVKRQQLSTVPALITIDFCARSGIDLSVADRQRLLIPQVRADTDQAALGRLLQNVPNDFSEQARQEAFLNDNPNCIALWTHVLSSASDRKWVQQLLTNADPRPEDPELGLAMVQHFASSDQTASAMTNLKRVASNFRGDPRVALLGLKCAQISGYTDLLPSILTAWRKQDQTFLARYYRAWALHDWASDNFQQDYTAGGVGFQISAQTRELMEESRRELHAAVEIHHSGWQAHTLLISLCTALGSPREEMEKHFVSATALVKGNLSAYRRKLQYLLPSRHGSIEDVAAFAQECIQTELWEAGIPQLAIEAVQSAISDPADGSTSFVALRDEHLWKVIQTYKIAADKFASVADRKLAHNCFALWGAASGHRSEVASIFETIMHDSYQEAYSSEVFETPITFHHLRDLVLGANDAGGPYVTAAYRLALDEGNLDRADELLKRPVATDERGLRNYFQAAIEAGRKLNSERQLDLSGPDALDILQIQTGLGSFPFPVRLRDPRFTRIINHEIVWTSSENHNTFYLSFPIGLRRGVITGEFELNGTFERFGILMHTRALRDVITMMYLPQTKSMHISRGRRLWARFPFEPGRHQFRLEFGEKEDRIDLGGENQFTFAVVDDVPSGFAFEGKVVPRTQGVAKIAKLRIELSKDK